jgi:hypothetical protein
MRLRQASNDNNVSEQDNGLSLNSDITTENSYDTSVDKRQPYHYISYDSEQTSTTCTSSRDSTSSEHEMSVNQSPASANFSSYSSGSITSDNQMSVDAIDTMTNTNNPFKTGLNSVLNLFGKRQRGASIQHV